MNISSAYRIHGPHGLQGPHSPRQAAPSGPALPTRGADSVDISAAADAAASAGASGDVRAELVSRVRKQIAAGTYETPSKLEAAVARLLDELG
jgi:negative regulator of flagellin synthesis FlgM